MTKSIDDQAYDLGMEYLYNNKFLYNFHTFPYKLLIRKVIGSNDAVLEIGTGTGEMGTCFGNKRKVIGLDFNLEFCKKAKEKNNYSQIVCGDATKLPFKTGVLDCIISFCTLEHIKALDDIFTTFNRTLNDAGTACFGIPTDGMVVNFFKEFTTKGHVEKHVGKEVYARMFADQHVNRYYHILASAKKYFKKVSNYYYPFLIPIADLNYAILGTYKKYPTEHSAGVPSPRPQDFMSLLACPDCHGDLSETDQGLTCTGCAQQYPIIDGIPVFVPQ